MTDAFELRIIDSIPKDYYSLREMCFRLLEAAESIIDDEDCRYEQNNFCQSHDCHFPCYMEEFKRIFLELGLIK